MNARVYIGPSFPGLTEGTIFYSDLPPYLKNLFSEKYPSARHLIVPVSSLQQARKDMHVQGQILNFYLKQLLKELENGV
jgi:hypothetical protein